MTASASHLPSLLARLLDYPGNGFDALLDTIPADAPSGARAFARTMRVLPPEQREELHAVTFDITPACVPYTGIHLFGEENFKRGEYMAAVLARQVEAGFDPRPELPDHIGNLLRFLPSCPADEQRALAEFCILGPLAKMTGALSQDSPYHHLLAAIHAAMEQTYPGVIAARNPLDLARESGAACPVTSPGCSSCGPLTEAVGPSSSIEPEPVIR